jgi:hypothetical protein
MDENLENELIASVEGLERPGNDVSVNRHIDSLITTTQEGFNVLMDLDKAAKQIRMLQTLAKARTKAVMKYENCREYESDGYKMFVATEKKDQFDNEAIYDFYNVNPGFRLVLPRNPDFKKTVLKKDMGEDFKDVCTTVDVDSVKLKAPDIKIMDTKYLG